MRYYCGGKCRMSATDTIGALMDRAPRPYTAGEISAITGIPIGEVQSFLLRNLAKGRISFRIVPRRYGGSTKPKQREYWRGVDDVSYTFGRGKMMTGKEAEQLATGKRPVQWKASKAVWSVDEQNEVAVRRGVTIVCMGQADRVRRTNTGVSIEIKDGPTLTFKATTKQEKEKDD